METGDIKCQPVGPLGLDRHLVPSYSNHMKIIVSFDGKVVITFSFDSSEIMFEYMKATLT